MGKGGARGLWVVGRTFCSSAAISFDSSINSLNPNSEQQEKKKKTKIKPNQIKNQNQTGENEDEQGEAATKWGREGFVGCGLSPCRSHLLFLCSDEKSFYFWKK
jgi:hypothetical protein